MKNAGAPVGLHEDELLRRARNGDESAFAELADRFHPELHLHCYRIVGSVQDAEDLVQETLLAAWRGLERFERRASLRTWLYRIATNRCLNALRDRGRRLHEPPAPVDATAPPPQPTRLRDPVWLEPYPDVLLERAPDRLHEPEARYETHEAIGLAFVAGLQRLPPRQRAVLVLRDVLAFRATEVAAMLGVTEVSVNRTLHRARGGARRAARSARRCADAQITRGARARRSRSPASRTRACSAPSGYLEHFASRLAWPP